MKWGTKERAYVQSKLADTFRIVKRPKVFVEKQAKIQIVLIFLIFGPPLWKNLQSRLRSLPSPIWWWSILQTTWCRLVLARLALIWTTSSKSFVWIASGIKIRKEVALFKDCAANEITLREIRNYREQNLAPFRCNWMSMNFLPYFYRSPWISHLERWLAAFRAIFWEWKRS